MKVLFLLSCLEPAGSETYCVSLANAWAGRHEVFWISDKLHYGQSYTSMPIHKKAFPGGLINALRVASFIRKNKIQLIHSHSRRAHWVAAQAAFLTRIPHVTTVHQPPPVHIFSKLFPCLGDISLAIDEAVVDHLVKRFNRLPSKIKLVRNGVDLARFVPSTKQPSHIRQIVMIGRLSGGRWNTFQFFLDTLKRCSRSLPQTNFKIMGRVPESRREALVTQLQLVNAAIAPSRVELVGFVKELLADLRDSDGIIAGGRSAMEGMACAKPVLLMGEGGVIGLAQPSTWNQALRTNMGDHIEPKQFNTATLESALRELTVAGPSHWNREQVERSFNSQTIATEVERVYRALLS